MYKNSRDESRGCFILNEVLRLRICLQVVKQKQKILREPAKATMSFNRGISP